MDRSDIVKDDVIIPVLLLLIGAVLVLFYLPILNNWFRSDDIYLMWASGELGLHEMFFSPERHRVLSSNFNPMYGVSFKADWTLFRMNPTGYAVHCILSILAASVMLYLFLRLYAGKKSALFGVFLFLFNPITLHMASLFFRRHYTEGLFWALLGLYSFVKADRKGKVPVFAAVCYLVSSLYREVYVVLPAIAFLISGQNKLLSRLRNTAPLWAGLLVYTLWRLWIWKGIGGYPSNQPFLSLQTLQAFPEIIRSLSLQWSHNYPFLMYFLLTILFLSSLKYYRLLVCFLILFIPILPVSNIISGDLSAAKYFFHMTTFLVICIALLIDSPPISNRRLFSGVLLLLCVLFTPIFIKQNIRQLDSMRVESDTAKKTAMEYMHSGKPFIIAQQDSWFYIGLSNISRDYYGKDIRTQIVPSHDFLIYADPKKLLEIKESGIDIPYREIVETQGTFEEGPVAVKIVVDNYTLRWNFGPGKEKTYTLLRSLVSGLYYNKSELSASGTYMLPKGRKDDPSNILYVRVLYQADNGKTIITPEFPLRIPGRQKIEYEKPEIPRLAD